MSDPDEWRFAKDYVERSDFEALEEQVRRLQSTVIDLAISVLRLDEAARRKTKRRRR